MIAQLWLSLSITKLLSCHISNPFYPQIINYHEEDWFCVCVRPSWACQWTFNQSNDSKSDKKSNQLKRFLSEHFFITIGNTCQKVKKPPRLKNLSQEFELRFGLNLLLLSLEVPLASLEVPSPYCCASRYHVAAPQNPSAAPRNPRGKILRPKV